MLLSTYIEFIEWKPYKILIKCVFLFFQLRRSGPELRSTTHRWCCETTSARTWAKPSRSNALVVMEIPQRGSNGSLVSHFEQKESMAHKAELSSLPIGVFQTIGAGGKARKSRGALLTSFMGRLQGNKTQKCLLILYLMELGRLG